MIILIITYVIRSNINFLNSLQNYKNQLYLLNFNIKYKFIQFENNSRENIEN